MIQYVVYKHPKDYPHHYVVRAYKITESGGLFPLEGQISNDLHKVRDFVPEGLVRLERSEDDDPCIVEVWV